MTIVCILLDDSSILYMNWTLYNYTGHFAFYHRQKEEEADSILLVIVYIYTIEDEFMDEVTVYICVLWKDPHVKFIMIFILN